MKKKKKKPAIDFSVAKDSGTETWLHAKNTNGSEPGSKPEDRDKPEETWLGRKPKRKEK